MSLEWMARAGCLDEDPEIFFDASPVDALYAKSVCDCCPVNSTCEEFAGTVRATAGRWGDLDLNPQPKPKVRR